MIRPYREDDGGVVQEIYRLAFSSPPWNRPVSRQEAAACWQSCLARRGFECLVAELLGQVAGFTCWDTPTLRTLEQERGLALTAFVRAHGAEQVVWWRETCVKPGLQNQGLARRLKEAAWRRLLEQERSGLVLTRMREDNPRIIRLNLELGFRRTGIQVSNPKDPGILHEYWYRIINKKEASP